MYIHIYIYIYIYISLDSCVLTPSASLFQQWLRPSGFRRDCGRLRPRLRLFRRHPLIVSSSLSTLMPPPCSLFYRGYVSLGSDATALAFGRGRALFAAIP